MRKTIAIAFSLLILLLAWKDLVIYGLFKVNQDYIAEVLCINRAKPELKCNGHCHLSKTLEENNNPQKKSPIVPQQDQQNAQFSQINKISIHLYMLNQGKQKLHFEKLLFPDSCLSDIFHPPESVS